MGCVSGPLAWLSSGSDGHPSLPEAPLDALFGAYAPDDANALLEDFGHEVSILGLGTTCILYDELTFVDDNGTPVDMGSQHKLARFKRGVFDGARLSGRTLEIVNATATAKASFKVIGPVPRDSSLFDRYVLEPLRKESAA